MDADDSAELLQSMSVDALVTGKVTSPSSIEKDIDAVTLDSVNAVRIACPSVL